MKKKNIALVMLVFSMICSFSFGNVAMAAEQDFTTDNQIYCLGDAESKNTISLPLEFVNGEEGYLSVTYEPQMVTRANGDPVVAGYYTVSLWSPMTEIEYKVNTSTEGKITKAYDLYYSTLHEVLDYDLYWTDYRANLDMEVKFMSVAGTFRFYLDFYIEDGKVYTETNY